LRARRTASPQKRTEIERINQRIKRLLDSFLDELIDRETLITERKN
jgi:hypothetical protein